MAAPKRQNAFDFMWSYVAHLSTIARPLMRNDRDDCTVQIRRKVSKQVRVLIIVGIDGQSNQTNTVEM